MYHSLIIHVDDRYIDTYDDWRLVPSSRPVIAAPMERTSFVTVPGRDGVLDYSQSVSKRPVFDNRTGKIEFYLENDVPDWDWETAYTSIIAQLQGKRVRMALEDNPAHYYEGLLFVNQYKSDKGHSKITLEYNLHPTMKTLNVGAVVLNAESVRLTKGMEFQLLVGVGPTDTFFRKVNVTANPRGIVEITQNGTIRALRKGSATVTAECGGVKAECAVEVGNYRSYPIARTLNGCVETNPVNAVVDGGCYQNIISVKDAENSTLELAVTVGGEEAPAGCVTTDEGGTRAEIKMESVTGAVNIVANAAAKPQPELLSESPAPAAMPLKNAFGGGFRL